MISEPETVAPESEFEAAVADACKGILASAGLRYGLLPRFGLDIALLIEHPSGARWRFLEAKAFFGQRMGGVPVGNDKGGGRQLDMLLLPDSELTLADGSVRWVLADALRAPGEPRYAMFSSTRAKAAIMAGARRNKNNNLRISAFAGEFITWRCLIGEIEKFLTL